MRSTINSSKHCVAAAGRGRVSVETFTAEAAGLVTFRGLGRLLTDLALAFGLGSLAIRLVLGQQQFAQGLEIAP